MPPEGYRSVSISTPLLEEAEHLMDELRKIDVQPYTNITAFVVDAIRRRIEELRRLYFLGESGAQ
jgi:hypothetical protein